MRYARGCRCMIEVELTDISKTWVQEHYPQGIVWEYDVDTPFKLHGWASEFIEFTCRARERVSLSFVVIEKD